VQARAEVLDAKMLGLLISQEDVTKGDLIGQGGYGSVYKGILRGSVEVAVKYVQLATVMMQRDQMDVKREAYIHTQAHHHPNICKLLGVMLPSSSATTPGAPKQPSNEFVLVMELLHGDLGQYLRSADGEMLSMEERLKLALDISEGMAHLHSKNIVHGDLKPGNLLTRKVEGAGQVQVVVSDFGLSSISCVTLCTATLAAQAMQSSSTSLSLWYSPPEHLNNCVSKKTAAGDVYAFGVILYEIFTGKHPYVMFQYEVVLKNVLEGNRPTLPEDVDVPEGCKDLMDRCWSADPAARPSFSDIKQQISELLAATLTDVQ
jgi:serine/threonine protein kinase